MMARRLAGILPPLTLDEAVEVTTVHSVAGLIPPGSGLLTSRPFRAPHHTVSDVALVGGGSIPRPGEISLAHHGVLFLDEMPEFSRHALEVLRQPLEEDRRDCAAARTATFPAGFMLVGAMNPCPCGYAGTDVRPCRCTPQQADRYAARLSGPLRDRIDLAVPVAALPPATSRVTPRRSLVPDSEEWLRRGAVSCTATRDLQLEAGRTLAPRAGAPRCREPDVARARGEPADVVRACLRSCAAGGPDDCRPCRVRGRVGRAPGRGAAIPGKPLRSVLRRFAGVVDRRQLCACLGGLCEVRLQLQRAFERRPALALSPDFRCASPR